jgi:predicted nucleic acid-binding protein
VILLDTSGIVAAVNSADPSHEAAARALLAAPPPRMLSPFVLAEIDYLLATRVGADAELKFLGEVAKGVYTLAPFGARDVGAALAVIGKYRDLAVGLADASIVVLADRHAAHDVLTLDERHFRTLRPDARTAFRLHPTRL